MKKILIISPYFPPTNAADMQRVRISLPYYSLYGWDAEVVVVDEAYSDMVRDELLLESIPQDIKIHKVKALNKRWTSKLGLGSIGLRSLYYYMKEVNCLLKNNKYDLIYFSTTQFPVCILGAYWKRKFRVHYVIDMQDPWYSTYYEDKPKEQRPPKYWFSQRLNKYLEPIAMKHVSGLISVSTNYIADLKQRYPAIKKIPEATITFGAFKKDMEIAQNHKSEFSNILLTEFINIVYIGRGGNDMHKAIDPIFKALKNGIESNPKLFKKLKFYFIGTSYATSGKGVPTIAPLADFYGISDQIIEITDRISYYHTLNTLIAADALFIPGSDDPQYSASKIYPYLLTKKPLIAIFNENSNAVDTLLRCTIYANIFTFGKDEFQKSEALFDLLLNWSNGEFTPVETTDYFENFSAGNLTLKQTELFLNSLKN